MDANGLRFWMLADGAHWMDAPELRWDGERRSLRLASRRPPRPRDLPSSEGEWATYARRAEDLVDRVPQARDGYGTRARWDATLRRVMASGVFPDEVPIVALWRGDVDATDIALGHDGVFYAVAAGEVMLHDRRGRKKDQRVRRPGFHAWRIACDPAGGVWVLDRAHRKLGHTAGQLWPDRPWQSYDPDVFRPDPENPSPPRLRILKDARWEAAATVAVACSPRGRVAILTWDEEGEASLHVLLPDGVFAPPIHLDGARYAHALAWVAEDRVCVMVQGVAEAPAYPVPTVEALRAMKAPASAAQAGDVYPLRGAWDGPFVHTPSYPPHYMVPGGTRPLHALSLPSFAPRGEAMNLLLLDSVEPGTPWHRLYVEAAIPPRCSITLHLAATETPSAPVAEDAWHAHRFGGDGAGDAQTPRGAWVAGGTEIPFADPLLAAPSHPERAGLWTALVQRPGRAVRTLRGRYLWVRAELRGDGRTSPELATVRAYGSRFSYRDRYLPELYRETVFGADADAEATRSTPADFLERFLGNFEGVLTGIEDRIAHAYLATDPRTAPAESLEWLAGWIGFASDPGLPEARRRRMLAAAPEMARLRGTLEGLRLALDLATDGAVSGGEIVILEDWKLRRTFATILGADLADEDDPLTAGLAVSGNSFVGDTLFLGEEGSREFLALYDAGTELNPWEKLAVAAFFERLSHRLTILVHREVEEVDVGVIRRVVEREVPAHVEARVVAAPGPLMVGVSSLIGVDTYLARKPGQTPVRIDRSRVGVRDHLVTPLALDPRLEGGSPEVNAPAGPPVARLAWSEMRASVLGPVLLDGTLSEPPVGHWLETYRWSRK